MKNILSVLFCFLIFINVCFSQTVINSGDVYGLWEKSKSPYQIFGEIAVPNNQTLTIEKGVKVEFQGHYKLSVLGRLLAIGDKSDSIIFNGKDTTLWGGIRFDAIQTANDTSKLCYCVVEHCFGSSGQLPRAATFDDYGGGICMISSKLVISNSSIRYNKAYIGGGIFCSGNITLINTEIRNNKAESACGGLGLSMSNPKVIGCVIVDNFADQIGGMSIDGANALLINNTICNNISANPIHGSVYIRGSPKIFNTIFFYNRPNLIHIDDKGSSPEFQFCNLENGLSGFVDYYPSLKGTYDGVYKNNIETLPLFMDMQKGNYRLGISPCINTGNVNSMNFIPQNDIDGNPRIYNDSKAQIDIGAYEFQGTTPNRKTYIRTIDAQYILRSQKSKLAINYFDADRNDKPSFKVTTNSSHVAVHILSVNDSIVLTEIDPEMSWRGECYVYINMNDNTNSNNSTNTDSIKVIISNRFKGEINSKVNFTDTVLIVGDILIKELGDLEILPGSFVEFQDYYSIKVLGKLNILGTILNKIVLNSADTAVFISNNNKTRRERGWGGIEFIEVNSTDTMHINYCLIKNTGMNKDMNRENGTISITDSKNIYFNNCTFESNSYESTGKKNSGVYAENSHNIKLKNCGFTKGYTVMLNQGAYVNAISSDLVIDSCRFYNSDTFNGGYNWRYVVCEKSAVQIINSSFLNNTAVTLIASYDGSLIVENCTIKDNKSDGIETYTNGAVIRNNCFINNRVAIQVLTNAKIINNLIAYSSYICGCSNFNGSAIDLVNAGKPLIANNTIVNNYQDSNGNAIYASYCSPTIVNNIFWNNKNEGVGFYNGAGLGIPNPIVKNNIIKGVNDNFNFNIEPSFRLNDSLDYSLLNSSLAINAGLSDTTGLYLPRFDILGNKRIDITYGKLDIGAFEYSKADVPVVTGIETVQTFKGIDFYPNPTYSAINLSNKFNALQYKIFNLNGQIVQSGTITNNSIDVKLLPKNTYLLKIAQRNRSLSATFIKL